jgi:hypothetical protein
MNVLKKILVSVKTAFRVKRYLCDTCKYDYGDVCHRPERPNAITCPDYKRR